MTTKTTGTQIVPLTIQAVINKPKKISPGTLIVFLLGAIASKWMVSYTMKKIRFALPHSKKSIAIKLKESFGGFIYERQFAGGSHIVYECVSKDSFNRIRKAVKRYRKYMDADQAQLMLDWFDYMLASNQKIF